MSIRVDSSSWISGAIVVGQRGLGVPAENIPSTGDAGPSFLFNDLSLPADNGKEICGRITTWPTNGTLVANENGAFIYTPLSDGTDSFAYQLKVDGVDVWVPVTVGLQAGSPVASFAQTTDDAVATFAAHVSPRAAFTTPLDDAAFSGGAATTTLASFFVQTEDAVFIGGAISHPIAAFSIVLGDAVFAGGASITGAPAICSFAATTDDAVAAFSATVIEVVVSVGVFSVTLDNAVPSFSAMGQAQTGLTLSQADIDAIAAVVLQTLASLQPGVVQVTVTNYDQIAASLLTALNSTTGARTLGEHLQIQTAVLAGEESGAGTTHISFTDNAVVVEADVPLPGQVGNRTNVAISGV